MAFDEKILSKIKKCLALGQSSEPEEAAAAMRQAQKLMQMHGVTQTHLDRADIGEAVVKSKTSVSRVKDWELALVNTVARAFGCQLLWSKSFSDCSDPWGRYILIGLKSQVELASYTLEVLQRRLIKSRNSFVGGLSEYMSRREKTFEADGFCHGWVQAVSKTVIDFALTEIQTQLIKDRAEEISSGTAKVRRRNVGTMGLQAGYNEGSGESIHRPVGRESHPMLVYK